MRFDNVLYGVAYYHEYMPDDRLDKDVALMKEAGISVVRMGESTWSLWEPADGIFEYAWMDRWSMPWAKPGLRSSWARRPTPCQPGWPKTHPEFWPGRWAGLRRYGMRQNMDTDNPKFRFYAERAHHQHGHALQRQSGGDRLADR